MLTHWLASITWMLANLRWGCSSVSDCSKRLDVNSGSCCAIPDVNFEPYRQSCGHFLNNSQSSLIPCLVDCIFNASHVLIGNQMNADNARKMTEQLMSANPDFVDISVTALLNCSANKEQWEKFHKRRFFGNYKCSLLPLYLRTCAVEIAFVNCPTSSWKGGKACEEAREYKLNCKCDLSGRVCSART
ncbi:uncharacterized protein LOC111600773 [Drosophila hydei]|uniref:Uncharacterized protein LOC111600773 n=1 Tax=Drosophila hydei TaxID=7224 RepID=A0A6J1LX21_DROHY|nr:uncharacterized protein LOC111600773 [Drosophila hydei]